MAPMPPACGLASRSDAQSDLTCDSFSPCQPVTPSVQMVSG